MPLTITHLRAPVIERPRVARRKCGRPSLWSAEREAMLERMWGRMSASRIADELGGISRSAVIGKAHRMGLAL